MIFIYFVIVYFSRYPEGCWHHGHYLQTSCKFHKENMSEKQRKYAFQKAERTRVRREYLESLGYEVITINECDFFKCLRHKDLTLSEVVNMSLPNFAQKNPYKIYDLGVILDAVESGELFGVVQCTVEVPDHLWSHFKEFSPIFQTVDVPIDAVGEHMKDYVHKMNISDKPRRVLGKSSLPFHLKACVYYILLLLLLFASVGGMRGKNLVLSSDLLQWYIKHGLKVSDIKMVVEFPKGKPFQEFQKMVTEARRRGDIGDVIAKVRGLQAKLIGVSYNI